MLHKMKLILADPAKSLWIHPTLGAVFAVVFSLVAKLGVYLFSSDAVPNISVDTLSDLLNIIASSMLAVTTFSLSIMVSALASSSNSATPRARLLIMADDTARIAIASFIAAFIYSVIAKIALSLEYYGVQGRFILFISTILVLMYIIFTLIRWVHTLSQLGSLGDAIQRIEKVAVISLARYRAQPNLGASHLQPTASPTFSVPSPATAYICDIDLQALNQLATEHQLHVHIAARPGKFIALKQTILEIYSTKTFDENRVQELQQQLAACILIESNRRYEQDPRLGLLVMSEVGQRAMSASINDPATAISVLNALTRVLIDTQAAEEDIQEFEHLSIVPMDEQAWIESIFAPIARDSVNNLEINQRLLKCLGLIAQLAPEAALQQAARAQAQQVLQRTLSHLTQELDQQQLQQCFDAAFKAIP
jgi:uncharacterized membrane protein